MFKVLIVDDEPLIRRGLIKKVDWNLLGFEIIAEASNGIQALEYARKLSLDLIITDMKMPVMDGIQLLQAMKEIPVDAKIIVISAYSSFHFTQAAIKGGAFDYILKPIDSLELEQVLIRVREELLSSGQKPHKQKTDTLPVMKEQFLNSFLDSDILPRSLYSLPGDKQYYVCLALLLPSMDCITERNFSNDYRTQLSEITLRLETMNRQQKYFLYALKNPKYNRHFYIIVGYNNFDAAAFHSLIENMKTDLESCLSNTITIGVGDECSSLDKLNHSATQAMNALSYRSISCKSCIIYNHDVTKLAPSSIEYSSEAEHTFLTSLEICNYEEVEHNIQKLFTSIRQYNDVSFRQVYKLFSELLFLCERVLREYKISFDQIFEEDITSIDYIASKGSLPELEQWFLGTVTNVMNLISNQKCTNMSKTIDDIKEYIDTHYYEDLNLTDLSKKYYINKSYLSTLFKKRVDQNFLDYLTTVRMNQAIQLLTGSTSYKVYEISQLVGYPDVKYFCKLFKKRYGISPERFRYSKI